VAVYLIIAAEERLDDNKAIMSIVKKWPKKGDQPKLVFKSPDTQIKLQTKLQTKLQDLPVNNSTNSTMKATTINTTNDVNNALLDDEDSPVAPVSIPAATLPSQQPSSMHEFQHIPSMPPKKAYEGHSVTKADESKNTNIPQSSSPSDQALLILDNFEKKWRSGGIQSAQDILKALGA